MSDEKVMVGQKDSILNTIKKMLGVTSDYNAFDMDIIIDINSAFMVLNQLGVGPDKPFMITSEDECWDDFLDGSDLFEALKSYIYLKVKILFDPPTSGVLHEAMERLISEYEFRLNVQAETPPYTGDDRHTYQGDYVVIPKVYPQSMETQGLKMREDVEVEEIPYSLVANRTGETVTIGGK